MKFDKLLNCFFEHGLVPISSPENPAILATVTKSILLLMFLSLLHYNINLAKTPQILVMI